MFRKKALSLLVISALLLPFIFLVPDSMTTALILLLFIALQVIIIFEFSRAEELGWEHWYAFWTALLSLGFSLFLVITGRTLFSEFIALLLFMVYFIMVILFLFKDRLAKAAKRIGKPRKPKEKKADDELGSFRRKDQLKELVDFFEVDEEPDARYVEIKEPAVEKIIAERIDDEPEKWDEQSGTVKQDEVEMDDEAWKKIEEVLDAEEWKEIEQNLPKSAVFDYSEVDEKDKPLTNYDEEPDIRELKEAPKVDISKVMRDLEALNQGTRTISEKIKEISERALKEGEEKKRIAKALKKLPRPKKKEIRVYASKTGNKFHYKRSCLGLRRVKNKDMLSFTNSDEAKKKGLKACGMCK
jgi:hypothetical protein